MAAQDGIAAGLAGGLDVADGLAEGLGEGLGVGLARSEGVGLVLTADPAAPQPVTASNTATVITPSLTGS
ncbi:MAG: hypothetical protein M3082_15010 [Candidatus Dormibacteraeota bacterium]|nr:hypothetical protein [Candidatus Dormibacteraeota bacterium]